MSIYSKEFLAIYMPFFELANILWEAKKPAIVLTDDKSVTIFFQTKPFHHLCGMHANMCYNSTLKWHILLAQSTHQLIFSPDWNSKSRRRLISKFGRIYQERPLKSQHLPQMLQMQNYFSSRKQMVKIKPKNRSCNEKDNLGKKQQNG